jgi:hypothetical protein
VVNHSLEPRSGLKVRARLLDPAMRVLFDKQENAEVAANSYRDIFELPKLPYLPPVYFVRLDLSDAAGNRVSDNLYWLPAQKGGSMQALHSLPLLKVQATCKIEARGAEKVARVKVTNPTGQIAFFVQLVLTQGRGGAEILPVLWEDNYLSLLPGESREVTATFAAKDAGKDKPTLGIGGWNVESDFDCAALAVSPKEIKSGERFTVTASIANTFLDGSRVALRLDGKPAAFKWTWARAGRKELLRFPLTLEQSGRHEVAVGGQKLSVTVQP